MSTVTGTSVGSLGYVGVAKETTHNTFVAAGSDQFLLVDAPPTLGVKYDAGTNMVASNSPYTARSVRTNKGKVGGQLQFPLYPNMGMLIAAAALGSDTYLSAVTSDSFAASGGMTTAGGITTLTLTTGSASYQVGAWVKIDAGASVEYRQILTAPASTTLTVAALSKAHSGTVTIQQVAQHKITPRSGNSMYSLSVEENVGNKYAWQYPGGYVDKYAIKAGKDKMGVTADLLFDAQRTRPATPTAFSVTSQTDSDLTNFFNANDGFIVANADETAAGTSSQQQILWCEDWTFTIDNKCIQKPLFDGADIYRVFPGGEAGVTVDFSIVNEANRQAIFEDFLKSNTEMPFFLSLANPAGNLFGLRIPALHVLESDEIRAFNDTIGESIKAQARQDYTHSIAEIYVVNAITSAY